MLIGADHAFPPGIAAKTLVKSAVLAFSNGSRSRSEQATLECHLRALSPSSQVSHRRLPLSVYQWCWQRYNTAHAHLIQPPAPDPQPMGLGLQRHNIGVSHLCRLNASSAHPCLSHRRHGGPGRCKRRLLLPNGCSVDHWALVTALTPFWRCGESGQRYCLLPQCFC